MIYLERGSGGGGDKGARILEIWKGEGKTISGTDDEGKRIPGIKEEGNTSF